VQQRQRRRSAALPGGVGSVARKAGLHTGIVAIAAMRSQRMPE
jgi:hypothetical protein